MQPTNPYIMQIAIPDRGASCSSWLMRWACSSACLALLATWAASCSIKVFTLAISP